MSRRNQNPWTPETKTGVNYFKHQTKHFLTPYGKTHGLLTSREILDKLFHWNCEWLTRPNYAISELADTLNANLATLAKYKDKVFTRHAVDPLLNKARPIRTVLQRFNKKDSATAEEPDECDLADLMKFIEDDTLKSLCKHLFAASGTMFSIATHMMTLETLFSHPADYGKRHRESPEVQSFKQNPSRESMVAYIASQTLSHTEIVPEEEQGGSIWDALTQRSSTRQARQTATFWDAVEENVEDDEAKCPYEDDDQEEQIAPPTRRRPRPNILDEDEDQYNEEEEPFNTQESSAEHALFITQQDPDPYQEPGTLSPTQKGKTPAARKRPSCTTNIWASFGLSAESSTSAGNSAPAAKRKATAARPRVTTRGTTRGRGRGARGKRAQPTGRHTYFD